MYTFPWEVFSMLKVRLAVDSLCSDSVISVSFSTHTASGRFSNPLTVVVTVQMKSWPSPAILVLLIATMFKSRTVSAAGTEKNHIMLCMSHFWFLTFNIHCEILFCYFSGVSSDSADVYLSVYAIIDWHEV